MNSPTNNLSLLYFRPWRGMSLILIALLIIGLAGVASAAPTTQSGTVLRIGYLGTADSDAARGAQLAIDQINSIGGVTAADGNTYQLALVTLAADPTPESLPNDIMALTAQNIVAFLGPDDGNSLSPENTQSLINTGLPVLTSATNNTLTDDDTADVLFRIRAPEHTYSYALASYLVNDLGLTSFVLVQTSLEATEALLSFEDSLNDQGLLIAGKVQLAGSTGLVDQAAGILELNPETVVMWGAPVDAQLLIETLRTSGWEGTFAYRQAAEATQAGILSDTWVEGVLGVTSWSYAYPGRDARTFLTDYLLTFGQVPGVLSATAYDALWYLWNALRNAEPEPEALRFSLLNSGALDLVTGTLNAAAFGNGDWVHTAMVYELGPGGGPTVVALFDSEQRLGIEDAGN